MGNKKVLSKATRELNKTKRFATPKNIIEDPRGQWAYPGEITRIPSDKITMQGVPYPVMAYPNMGEPQMMYPGQDYVFPGADYVDEYPQMQDGGTVPVIEDAGSFSAEGYWIPDWEAMKKQAKELNAKTVKTKNGAMIYFDDNWNVQSVDDNPQMKRGGTPKSLVKMPKPSKKGLASKKFSRSLEATNRLFTENPLFAKPKSRKRKVFDPNAQYQDGGVMSQEEIDAANNAMMKARLAYAYMHGNPAAQRMVVAPDQPYDFGNGMTGTHYMASMDNYAVPQIQDVNGQLILGDYGPESPEAIRFDTDEDANYFAENYKKVSPAFEEAELTEEEIEEYRKGGYIVEELDTYPRGGGLGKGKDKDKKSTKFKPKGNVTPFVTSDPEEYAYRKAAYDDSLDVANKFNRIMPKPNNILAYSDKDGNVSSWRKPTIKKHYVTSRYKTGNDEEIGMVSPAWQNYERAINFERNIKNYPDIVNKPVAHEVKEHYFPKHTGESWEIPGFFKLQLPDSSELNNWWDMKPRYQPPRQKIIFQEPKPKPKPKPKVHQYPTGYKPVVNNIPQTVPEGKKIVGQEEVQQLDPKTGKVTTVINPIYETVIPPTVNPELQKFVEERRPEPPGPPPGPGTDVMPVYYTDGLPEYATPDPDAEWVGDAKRYIDWDGNSVGYNLPRVRKPGHGGDLIRKGKRRYLHLPSIESRYEAEIVPEEEYAMGGAAASPFDLDPKTMKRYLADLKNQENNIKKGYRSGKWYPHPSPEGGLDTIAYGHKLTSRNSPYYQGISDEQAEALLLKDVLQNQALAKKQVDAKFGEGTFDSLPQDRQMLLVDYQYNLGTLAEFPKFVKAVVEGDTKTMIAEHTRYGGKDPLTRRNQWTLNVIDNLTQPIPEKPSNGVTIPLANVPDATNVVLPQIEGGPEGAIELELSPEEIEQYQMGGYIVEDVDATNEVARPCPPGYIYDPKVGRCVPENAYRLNRAAEKDDINVDDALRENRRYYEGYQFMKDWQNSPMYDKMLKGAARSPESYEYMKKMRQQQLDSTPPLQILPQPKDAPNTGGYSINATGQIVILPEGFRTRGTHSHELSHSSDRPVRGKRSRLIPQRDVDYINKNKAKTIADSRAYHNYKDQYDPIFKEYPEYKQQVDDSFREFSSDYVGEPTEVRARLNAIRQLAKEANLYDPFTEGVSPDLYYKKLKNYQYEKGDKSGFDPMKQLQDTFSDEEIIWMLNNISKNQDQNKELDVAQEGGEPNSKTTFYTVEGSGGVYRKVNGKWEVDWNRSGKFQPLSKGNVKERSAVLNKKAKPLYDATYDDLYATQRSAYTAAPKPTPAKKPTVQDKAAQEQFDKNFQVTGKSKMEVVEDKIQKTADDYAKYHQQQTGKPLTQEEYNDAYRDIYNRAYVDAGVYKPTMSGPTINPYGTTEERKNLVSLDPGKAPKNLTLGDYVDKGWDVVTNPLDYASYALRPKGTVTTPWNMTNYENRLEAAGLEDPVTANNNVNKAIDFASYFIGPGMVAQGLKMIPGTVNSIGRAFENPSWENTGDALFDAGMTALSVAPGFGIAKNLAKPAATIDDLKAIEALRGNTATTPFQSYFLTGDRALGASEAVAQQSQALRKFTEPQSLQLPAGRSPIMSESTRTQLTNPAVDSYFPVRLGDDPYAAAGNEIYFVDPEDYRIFNPQTQQYEYNPNWRQEGLQNANEYLDERSLKLPSFSSEATKGLGNWEFGQFTPGWEALQEAKLFGVKGPRIPKKTDYYTDKEFQDLLMNEMRYNISKDEQKIQEALTGKKFTDKDFENMSGGLKPSNFRDKYLTTEQENYVRQILFDNESVKSNPLLRENLEAALARSEKINPLLKHGKKKPFSSGDLPMSLNKAPEILPKGDLDSKNPLDQLAALIRRRRSKSELSALDDLDAIRLQSKTGQENAEELLNAEIDQKLKDLDTPEGRRRVEKYIKDNNLEIEDYDPGNFTELATEYQTELPRILANKYSDESQRIVELVRNRMAASKRLPGLVGLKSWNELEPEHILNNPLLSLQSYEVIVKADPRYTGSIIKRPLTHDEYVERIENILYKNVSEDISRIEKSINVSENEIKQLAIEKNKLSRDLKAEQDLKMQAMLRERIRNYDTRILDAHNKIAYNKQSINNLTTYLNRDNASFNPIENKISLGEPYTSIGDLVPTMTHEIGHGTEMVDLGTNNSAIDRALIKDLTFSKKAPAYLYKKLNPDKIRKTAPYNITNEGILKYRYPKEYFKSSLNYFKAGKSGVVGNSVEPTAFAVEMRPALKELGLIKGNYDIVTPEIIEQLYKEYTTNPKFQFRDIRILDIIDPKDKNNFKVLAKNYNDIKSLLPYAVPVGLGVGATGLAGQEEMQQDIEYQDGGIIMELTDDEIQQYANGGFVVEELDYKPDAGKPINKKTTTSNVGYTPRTISTPKASAAPKINLNTEGLSYKPTASVKTQNVNPKPTVSPKLQETAKPKLVPEITIDSMSTILNKYDIGNSSPVMTVDSFQTIINKQEQERIAKAEKLRKQIEVSQKKIERESKPSYKYPEVFVEGMPNVRTTQSESFIQGRPLKNEVKKIVLHHTGSIDEKNNSKYVHNHFMNPKSETSAHIVIEEDGQRTIYASPDQVTFHAGKSSWDGRSNVNDFGIGVEFQGDTNVKPLTSAQIKSFVEYFDQLAKKYNVSTEDIITHAMVAPGRKPDITDSQYKRILKYLKSRGYK